MTTHILPIVGAWYRPPAELILKLLPLNFQLTLIPEPDNPVDPNAIRIEVTTDQLKSDSELRIKLEESLPNFGLVSEEFFSRESIHLGYIPARDAVWLSTLLRLDQHINGELSSTPTGKPAVMFEL